MPELRGFVAALILVLVPGCRVASLPAAAEGWIRVNNLGWLPEDSKIAILAAEDPVAGRFTVGTFSGDVGKDEGAYGPFTHHYRLDLSAVTTPGRYTVRCGPWESREFAIGPDVFRGLEEALLGFVRLQRCGANPVTGQVCHAADGFDARSGRTLDLRGGWHDAGDRIKHVITTSWCVAALRLAGEPQEAEDGRLPSRPPRRPWSSRSPTSGPGR